MQNELERARLGGAKDAIESVIDLCEVYAGFSGTHFVNFLGMIIEPKKMEATSMIKRAEWEDVIDELRRWKYSFTERIKELLPKKEPIQNEPQLSSEIVEKIIEYAMAESSREPDGERLWIKTSYELADILRPILTKELATALEEQKQKVLSEVEGWLVDVDLDKVDEVFYEECRIKNSIYAELRAKLAEMKK